MERKYFLLVNGNDPIVVTVKDDVNRPNNPDCDAVLKEWVLDNYGDKIFYDYWEIDTCETTEL